MPYLHRRAMQEMISYKRSWNRAVTDLSTKSSSICLLSQSSTQCSSSRVNSINLWLLSDFRIISTKRSRWQTRWRISTYWRLNFLKERLPSLPTCPISVSNSFRSSKPWAQNQKPRSTNKATSRHWSSSWGSVGSHLIMKVKENSWML